MSIIYSLSEAHNLSVMAPPDLSPFNASIWGEFGKVDDYFGDNSPQTTNFPDFITSYPIEEDEPKEHDCGQNIRNMNFTPYDYPYRRETWIDITWREVAKVVAYLAVFLVSVSGNVLVILVVCYNTHMRSSTNQYLVNLAAADLLVTLVSMWVHIVRHLSHPNYVLPAYICKLDAFAQTMALLASVLTLTVISVGRFVAVMFPLHAHTSPNHAHKSIAAVWVLSAFLSTPILFYRELYSTTWSNFTSWACEEFWPEESHFDKHLKMCVVTFSAKKLYYTVLTIALYFLPVAIMIINYGLVVRTLWLTKLPGEQSTPSRNTALRSKKRVVKMVSVVLLVFVICWTPLQTLILYTNFCEHDNLPEWFPTMEFMAYFLAYSNSALNPIIYCGFNASFRQGLVTLLTCEKSTSHTNITIRSRWRGITTRDTTLGCSGPEPVLLELGSMKLKARYGVRWGVGWAQRGHYIFDTTRQTRQTLSPATTDQPHLTSHKNLRCGEQVQLTPNLTMDQFNPTDQATSGTTSTALHNGPCTINECRKLSGGSQSSCSSAGDNAGCVCRCYKKQNRTRKTSLPLCHENQLYLKLANDIQENIKEERV